MDCLELAKEGIIPKDFRCCSSCHYEWDDGYGEPIEVTLEDGRTCFVCCAVSDYLHEHGLLRR